VAELAEELGGPLRAEGFGAGALDFSCNKTRSFLNGNVPARIYSKTLFSLGYYSHKTAAEKR